MTKVPQPDLEAVRTVDIPGRLRTITFQLLLGEQLRVSERLRAKITALGTYVPPRVLTNKDFEKMVETTDEWILTRTGIRERHVVDKGIATSDLATEAAKCALAQRGIDPKDLDAILVATVTPDMSSLPPRAWCSTSLVPKVFGDSTFPLPARHLFMPCKPERSSSCRAHTRK